jgi:hypothetical protein
MSKDGFCGLIETSEAGFNHFRSLYLGEYTKLYLKRLYHVNQGPRLG